MDFRAGNFLPALVSKYAVIGREPRARAALNGLVESQKKIVACADGFDFDGKRIAGHLQHFDSRIVREYHVPEPTQTIQKPTTRAIANTTRQSRIQSHTHFLCNRPRLGQAWLPPSGRGRAVTTDPFQKAPSRESTLSVNDCPYHVNSICQQLWTP